LVRIDVEAEAAKKAASQEQAKRWILIHYNLLRSVQNYGINSPGSVGIIRMMIGCNRYAGLVVSEIGDMTLLCLFHHLLLHCVGAWWTGKLQWQRVPLWPVTYPCCVSAFQRLQLMLRHK
jgi:hypothetical protein